jgi:uracil-DNA glycosylase family 4
MDNPLSVPDATPPTLSLIGAKRVPNLFPTVEVPYRLAIIGEAPGADEEAYGTPFVGASGSFLNSILDSSSILRQGCFIGNVCKYRPPNNDIKSWGYSHPKVQEGLVELGHELAQFKPNCVLCLGNTPMWALSGEDYGLRDSGYSIGDFRGSIMWSSTHNTKYVGAYHPAYILREYKWWVLLRLDAMRARIERSQRHSTCRTETLN